MGEYADDVIDSGLTEDFPFGFTKMSRYVPVKWSVFEYKSVVRETEKAWLLKMSGDALTWWPKSECVLHSNGKTISVPGWLVESKMEEKNG